MAASLTGQTQPTLSFQLTPASGFLANSQITVADSYLTQFGYGHLADQCDLVYAASITFVTSTPQTLDLTSLTDVVGGAVNFARVRLVAIKNLSTADAAVLTVGNSVTNEWDGFLSAAGTLKVFPSSANNPKGGWVILTAPNTTGIVVDSTHKTLKLDPGANAFTVNVIIAGGSV